MPQRWTGWHNNTRTWRHGGGGARQSGAGRHEVTSLSTMVPIASHFTTVHNPPYHLTQYCLSPGSDRAGPVHFGRRRVE